MSKDKIKITNLYKSYKNGVKDLEVLKGVTLSVKENEFLTVQGPSGAGKSTLLHIVGSLEKPDSGEIIFDGLKLSNLNEGARVVFRNKKVGFVFPVYAWALPKIVYDFVERIDLTNITYLFAVTTLEILFMFSSSLTNFTFLKIRNLLFR